MESIARYVTGGGTDGGAGGKGDRAGVEVVMEDEYMRRVIMSCQVYCLTKIITKLLLLLY